ncbi:MAG: 2-amino-4-hydroxy-6-hydroxymethyldihydropteridine diphosphokinase [Micromonosporaceae bacterium]|nr:2-amino-4-hydroxy-6-hydroxymethyldihydropteridine diphosphokinase [Micromonosporaceae bacterium]
MTRALLSLGSNLGDRSGFLHSAVAGLGDAVLVVSGVYESPPWPPGEPGPAYLNAAVLAVDAGTDPRHWLAVARELERAAGRQRDPGRRNAPRTLDVDVIMVWDTADQPVISDHPDLTLPHPRAHLRGFVLRPWVDIQPYARLPGHGALTDLLWADPVATDLAYLRPRTDLSIESAV